MAVSAVDVLAGPIVRRVPTDRVSVWIALAKPAKVTLSIYAHAQVADATRMPLADATTPALRIGANLFCALPTIELRPGAHLEPGLIYDYDLALDGKNLAARAQ